LPPRNSEGIGGTLTSILGKQRREVCNIPKANDEELPSQDDPRAVLRKANLGFAEALVEHGSSAMLLR
jgi:hypothetical protein